MNASDAPDPYLDTEAGRLWLRRELRALARALRSTEVLGRQSAVDAMLFWMYRDRLCPGSAVMEAAMEKQEGLAEYTGVFIALPETGENISREARVVEALEDSNSFAQSFGYAVGPALGLLLDRYANGWRERADLSASLDSMLISSLHVQAPKDLERVVKLRAALYGYSAVATAEREREERHRAFLRELTAKFLERPTLDFPTAPEMSRNFNPQTLFPSRHTERIIQLERSFAANWGNCRWNPVVLWWRQTTVLYVRPREQTPTRGHFVVQDGFCKSHLVGPFARPDIQEVWC